MTSLPGIVLLVRRNPSAVVDKSFIKSEYVWVFTGVPIHEFDLFWPQLFASIYSHFEYFDLSKLRVGGDRLCAGDRLMSGEGSECLLVSKDSYTDYWSLNLKHRGAVLNSKLAILDVSLKPLPSLCE